MSAITFNDGSRRRQLTLNSVEAAEGEDGVFTATVDWLLEVDIATASTIDMLPDVVAGLFTDYLPIRGTVYHAGKPWVTCRTAKCVRVKGGVYKYTATYSDKNAQDEESGTNEDPLLDRPIVKSIAGMKPIAVYKDHAGDAIMNKAKDPIVATVDSNTVGVKVEANVANVPTWVLSLRNTTNNAAFTVGGLSVPTNGARFVLESDYVDGPKSRNDKRYLVFKYTLLFDEQDLHYFRPLNAGFNQLVNGESEAILLKDGSEPPKEVPLDDNGAKIDNPTPSNVKFLEFKLYPEADYSVLPGIS